MSGPGIEVATRSAVAVNPTTGELVDLAATPLNYLCEIVAGLQEHRDRLANFERAVNAHIVAELDRAASWTQRMGDPNDPTREFEVKAPSPEAGSAVYPVDALVPALRALVDAGTITSEAASKACARWLTLELAVPWDADLRRLTRFATSSISIQIAGVSVDVLTAEPTEKANAAGIKALRKIPEAAAELDRVKVTPGQAPRRATVKVKVRD